MSSLADLPELIGFFSYSREDDADSQGALSALRGRIQGELRGQLGRTAKTFRLWQDKEAIPSGLSDFVHPRPGHGGQRPVGE
jgi:hypothetical protein